MKFNAEIERDWKKQNCKYKRVVDLKVFWMWGEKAEINLLCEWKQVETFIHRDLKPNSTKLTENLIQVIFAWKMIKLFQKIGVGVGTDIDMDELGRNCQQSGLVERHDRK